MDERCAWCKQYTFVIHGGRWCPKCDEAQSYNLVGRVFGEAGYRLYLEMRQKKEGPDTPSPSS